MKVLASTITAVLVLCFGSLLPAAADSYWEVEAARANARAGGPISERDAELLTRYGCLSGTNNAFCDRVRYGGNSSSLRSDGKPRRRVR